MAVCWFWLIWFNQGVKRAPSAVFISLRTHDDPLEVRSVSARLWVQGHPNLVLLATFFPDLPSCPILPHHWIYTVAMEPKSNITTVFLFRYLIVWQLYLFLWDVLLFLQACSKKSLFAFQNRILLAENTHQEDRIWDYFLTVIAL